MEVGDIVEEQVRFPVGENECEGILAYPQRTAPKAGILLLAPHPLLGGNMDNNVVRHISRRAAEEGAVTLRFNYRGVGRSTVSLIEGQSLYAYFDAIEQEQRYDVFLPEVLAALDYLHGVFDGRMIVVGYSLGAVLAGMAAAQRVLPKLVCISPPNARVSLACFAECTANKLFLAGESDPFFDAKAFEKDFAAFPPPKQLIILRASDHFFRGEEEHLYRRLAPFTQ